MNDNNNYRAILPSPKRQSKWRFDYIIFKIRESDLVIEYMEFVFYFSLHILQVYQFYSSKVQTQLVLI